MVIGIGDVADKEGSEPKDELGKKLDHGKRKEAVQKADLCDVEVGAAPHVGCRSAGGQASPRLEWIACQEKTNCHGLGMHNCLGLNGIRRIPRQRASRVSGREVPERRISPNAA